MQKIYSVSHYFDDGIENKYLKEKTVRLIRTFISFGCHVKLQHKTF